MNKSYLPFFYLLLIGLGVSAQTQKMYFFKNDGKRVNHRDSADFLRIVKEPEVGSKFFVVNDQYLDGTPKSTAFFSKTIPTTYEGQYISYYRNGRKKLVANYKNGEFVDTAYHYYPNGNLYTTIVYVAAPNGKSNPYIKSVRDSTGKNLVTNGIGYYFVFDSEFKEVTESGKVKNGRYDGEWNGREVESGITITYKETYVDGKLKSGESIGMDGKISTYTQAYIEPQFKGGMEQFYAFLSKKLRYPPLCLREEIEGTVLLGFTVAKDGSTTDVAVLKAPDPLLAKEAVRVANTFPFWNPAIKRGKSVAAAYKLPVDFKISN